MSGFYLMHRGWQDSPIFGREPFSRRDAWVWMIEQAAYAERDINIAGKTVTVKRGQFSSSLRFMAKAWEWDEAKVRRFLSRAQKEKMIDASTDAGQTVITICNYDEYQPSKNATDAAGDAEATQQRRGSDAKYKQGKQGKELEEEEESGANAKPDLKSIFDAWNSMASRCAARSADKFTDKRRTAMRARVDDYTEAVVMETIDRIPSCQWLMGKNDRKWTADLDFYLRPDSITRIREGKYDHGQQSLFNGSGHRERYADHMRDPVLDDIARGRDPGMAGSGLA